MTTSKQDFDFFWKIYGSRPWPSFKFEGTMVLPFDHVDFVSFLHLTAAWGCVNFTVTPVGEKGVRP